LRCIVVEELQPLTQRLDIDGLLRAD